MDTLNVNLKAVTVLLRAAEAIHEVIKKDAARYGLNSTEFSALELLYHRGRQPIQLIGKKVLIASSSITYVVDKLEAKKYVIRQACPDDRRVTFVELTDVGRTLMESIFPDHELTIDKVFQGMEKEEVDEMIKVVKRVGYQSQMV